MSKKYNSQHGEDKYLENIINNYRLPVPKTFIDIGASDGVHANNCRRFASLMWEGVFVEPARHHIDALQSNCSGFTRCQVVEAAVSSEDGRADIRVFPNKPDHATLTSGTGGSRYPVQCVTYGTLLKMTGFGNRQIGIVSIDVEGMEEAVIKDVLRSANQPVFLIVESNGPESRKKQISLLNPLYHLIDVRFVNTIWVRRDYYLEHLHPAYRIYRTNGPH